MEAEVQVAVEMATAATAAPTVEEAGTQACRLVPSEEQPAVGAMEAEVQVAVEMATAATAAPTVEEAGTQACRLVPSEEQPAVEAMEAEVQVAVEMAMPRWTRRRASFRRSSRR